VNPRFSDSIVRQQSSAGPVGRGAGAPCPFPLPEKTRGAERRQALVRKAPHPVVPPRERTHLRIAGDHRPMTRAGAPLDALLRLSASLSRCFSSVRACVSRCQAGRQRAPRTGVIVPPGRVPKPPECRVTSPDAQAPHKRMRLPHSPRDRSPVLRPRIPLAPSNQRHRLTPLDEQGARIIRPDFPACVTSPDRDMPSRLMLRWTRHWR
jgi:hypothetical protein